MNRCYLYGILTVFLIIGLIVAVVLVFTLKEKYVYKSSVDMSHAPSLLAQPTVFLSQKNGVLSQPYMDVMKANSPLSNSATPIPLTYGNPDKKAMEVLAYREADTDAVLQAANAYRNQVLLNY